MLRIRLSRRGARKDPHYRVVVTEKSSPRDGRFVEVVGHYNPALKPVRLQLDLERVQHWIGKGAQPSQTVRSLIARANKSEESENKSAAPEKKVAAPAKEKAAPEKVKAEKPENAEEAEAETE